HPAAPRNPPDPDSGRATFLEVSDQLLSGGLPEMATTQTRGRPLWTFIVTGIALFMVSLDSLVVTNALPSIRADLGTGLEGLEWTVNGYTLTFAVCLLTGAALGDRYGRRKVLLAGLAVFTASSAVAALAPSIGVLVA